jgi:GT2 family glycosyltransferase
MRFADTELAPGLDAVVCNYRTPADLEEHLESIFHECLTGPDEATLRSITVVNVDPTDADIDITDTWCANINYHTPGLARQMSLSWNCGYAFACNGGAVFGTGGVIAFFNADTVLKSGVLTECYNALADNPSWAIVGPRQVDQSGAITHAGIFGPDDKPRIRGWKDVGAKHQDVRSDCYSVSGSAYFIKRAVWDELTACEIYQKSVADHANYGPGDALGAFLPTQHYYEETFCSVHARAHGWKIGYLGTTTMIHKWHKASAVGGHADRLMPESRALFRRACADHGIIHD